ncbi:4-hydroxyphenylpyruvate dioxygenase [Shewanella litorisediminis]|uniref:4-hydroxyphenylpyruvate dioxygenase n=1 Tax=Shewanella litorisediminis TaxID=1173586 RepID=A0ABX7G7M0_9GAMM|nr:4-hydroxyphenylpyruvate dioxygenase [Shewanella litorisediminis]MCL2919782.1 4-hydroxyphenylpyruvate dioxygenase [Shewanella litorisediminis]QRH03277.1 4-hydroxyphenylpyruvate dioxygenase [Shewanella litorisediminis]
MASETNPLGLLGIEFTEFATPDNDFMHKVFLDFGFSMLKKHKEKDIYYYQQNDINFLMNRDRAGFSAGFAKSHGPAITSMGWRVEDAEYAYKHAVERGAKAAPESVKDLPYPAIYGIGDSLIYFIDRFGDDNIYATDFVDLDEPVIVQEKGFMEVDHLTNNVYKGTMEQWSNFYKDVFGFTEVRYFDIKGSQTALISYALRSPDGSFCIPINEGKGDDRNQIDEYLREYNGPGVQHLAFRSRDIVASLDAMEGSSIQTLDIIPEYYDTIFEKLPQVTEDRERIKHHQILVDGDENGYLLQIFTKNLFGPIFIEIIQRKNNLGFGEGNFKALFESIERDQVRRGVL